MANFAATLEQDEEGLFQPQVVDDDGDTAPFDGEVVYEDPAGGAVADLVVPTPEEQTQYGAGTSARWLRGKHVIGALDATAKADGKVGEGEVFISMDIHVDFTGPQASEMKGGFLATRKITG